MELTTEFRLPTNRDYVNWDTDNPDINLGVARVHMTERYIAIAVTNGKIYLLNLDGQHERTLEGPDKLIWSMTSRPGSNVLISTGDISTRLWNTLTRFVHWINTSTAAIFTFY